MNVLLPYGIAILAQLPMLFLYFRGLWGRPHYQFFPFAILVVIVMAWMRWPRSSSQPYHQSVASNVLFWVGFAFAVFGLLFMEPSFSAISATLIATSLFARTIDLENDRSLWPIALPLFVCLILPGNFDSTIITRMQTLSAHFTSMILDLLGQGHNLDGIKITLASGKGYDVEQGCSGVVSFFTLVAITAAYVVWARRVYPLSIGATAILIGLGALLMLIDLFAGQGLGYLSIIGIGSALVGLLGFRAGILLMSTVFWSLLMNTIRILLIPLADVHMNGLDLSKGVPHDLLGYAALIVGILLVLSTDQFLLFLFGEVEDVSEDSSGLQRPITRFWNKVLAGKQSSSSSSRQKKVTVAPRLPMSEMTQKSLWIAASIIGMIGLIQLWFVRQSVAQPDLPVRFFDSDVTVDYQEEDLPKLIGSWERVNYMPNERSRGSDLGSRSDMWIYQGTKTSSVAILSLDQPFPGWHELTTCYRNQGWNLESRVVHSDEKTNGWPYIEAHFKKNTGEHGYLLFSLFDSQGKAVDAPMSWNSINSLFIRVKNRLSNRIRATLFDSQAYQTQAFLSSFRELTDDVKVEANERYLEAREMLRKKYIEKRTGKADQSTAESNQPIPDKEQSTAESEKTGAAVK
jgi:exosortase